MFNYNHLYYFYMTVKCGGISAAAKSLRIAQPSMSAQLHILEAQMDIPLFQKDGRRAVLTAKGEQVYGYCRKMFEAAEELKESITVGNIKQGERITIGVSDEVERPFVVEVLSSILLGSSNTLAPKVCLLSESHTSLIDALKNRRIDAIITNRSISETGIRTIQHCHFPVFLYGEKSFLKEMRITPTKSATQVLTEHNIGLVLPAEINKLRHEAEIFMARHKITNQILFESTILATIVRAALLKIGVGFLPSVYVLQERTKGNLVRIGEKNPLWNHEIFFATSSAMKKEAWEIKIAQKLNALQKEAIAD